MSLICLIHVLSYLMFGSYCTNDAFCVSLALIRHECAGHGTSAPTPRLVSMATCHGAAPLQHERLDWSDPDTVARCGISTKCPAVKTHVLNPCRTIDFVLLPAH